MWRRLIPVLVLVALVAGACGDDESIFEQGTVTTSAPATTGGETTTTGAGTTSTAAPTTEATSGTLGGGEQAMADQIAADLLAGGGGDMGLPIDQASAQCLGSQVVATFGVARLQELDAAAGGSGDLGSALELMTPEEQSRLVGVILTGADGQAPCIDVQGFLVDTLTESGLSAGSAECVADAFTQGTVLQDLLGAALGAGAEGEMDPEVATQLMTVMMGCLTPEELANMGNLDLGS